MKTKPIIWHIMKTKPIICDIIHYMTYKWKRNHIIHYMTYNKNAHKYVPPTFVPELNWPITQLGRNNPSQLFLIMHASARPRHTVQTFSLSFTNSHNFHRVSSSLTVLSYRKIDVRNSVIVAMFMSSDDNVIYDSNIVMEIAEDMMAATLARPSLG